MGEKAQAHSSWYPVSVFHRMAGDAQAHGANESPLKFGIFQPTYFLYHHQLSDNSDGTTNEWNPSLLVQWSARAHRKGGHPRIIGSKGYEVNKTPWSSFRWFGVNVFNISWWVAMWFLVGSVMWCINGIASFCYFTSEAPQVANLEIWSAFAGGTLFFIGGIFSYVESINPHPDVSLGHDVRSEDEHVAKPITGSRAQRHHFGDFQTASSSREKLPLSPFSLHDTSDERTWSWIIPPQCVLKSLSVGFVANVIQLYGATVFEISVILGINGILPPESGPARSPNGVLAHNTKIGWMAGYWGCQIYAAPAFFISGLIFMFEAQTKWYKPIIWGRGALGWHTGLWNALGGLCFLLSGIFGIWRETSHPDEAVQKWGTAFTTFMGSWFFLIGSYAQFLETLNPHAA